MHLKMAEALGGMDARGRGLLQTKQKQTPWPLVRERTIPTERPPLVDEILVPTFVDRGVSRGRGLLQGSFRPKVCF
jgi:hypothetical protein